MICNLFHQCDERAWKAFWNQRWPSVKDKRRRAGDNTPIGHAVLLSSVKEAHLATVIDLWQVAAVYAFVDNGAPFEEEKYDCLLQRLQDLGFKLDQLLLVPALG